MNDLLKLSAGDGAALAAPRAKSTVFGSFSFLFHGGGKVVDVRVVVATRKRWDRMCRLGVYDPAGYSLAEIRWTPLVVAVQVTY